MVPINGISAILVVLVSLVAIALVSYFLGCFNGAVIVSKYILRNDVRNHGSGNAGLTNFYRTFGGPLTLVVISTDVIKAILAVLMGTYVGMYFIAPLVPYGISTVVFCKYFASAFCLLGHMFPCMFGFKGGKGILSGGTIAIMLDWRIALVVWGGFLILVILTRYVSLGSCWAGASFPFVTAFVFPYPPVIVLGTIIGALILYMHRGNIQRLIKGEENKFSFKKKKST